MNHDRMVAKWNQFYSFWCLINQEKYFNKWTVFDEAHSYSLNFDDIVRKGCPYPMNVYCMSGNRSREAKTEVSSLVSNACDNGPET
jgi:hypothetical protein